MRGRLPKPTALKILHGNPGRHPLNRDEPQPKPGAKMPEYLLRLPRAAALWRQEAPRLIDLGVLTEVDAQAFARLCRMWSEDIESAVQGAPVNPRFSAELTKLEGRFGLNPSERSRIRVTGKQVSKLARFTHGA